jgi:hypothetical protein
MPFAADTKVKIMMALELPITVPAYVEYVERALLDAETYGGEAAVTAIENYLTQYEAAQTKLNQESANAGLIKADVLEWQPGARTGGFKQEMQRLRSLIANTLLLDSLMQGKPGRVQIRRG